MDEQLRKMNQIRDLKVKEMGRRQFVEEAVSWAESQVNEENWQQHEWMLDQWDLLQRRDEIAGTGEDKNPEMEESLNEVQRNYEAHCVHQYLLHLLNEVEKAEK